MGASGEVRVTDGMVRVLILVLEYGIVASLLAVAGVVLVRTTERFVTSTGAFPASIVPAIDGILVVIILLDVLQTVFRHLRSAEVPARPFIIVGILAGVRGILSASAHLTLAATLTTHSFEQSVIELGTSVGVVVALVLTLFLYDRRPSAEERRLTAPGPGEQAGAVGEEGRSGPSPDGPTAGHTQPVLDP